MSSSKKYSDLFFNIHFLLCGIIFAIGALLIVLFHLIDKSPSISWITESILIIGVQMTLCSQLAFLFFVIPAYVTYEEESDSGYANWFIKRVLIDQLYL